MSVQVSVRRVASYDTDLTVELRKLLREHPPLVFDGAMGTLYTQRSGSRERCELGNLDHPDLVLALHREYLEAEVISYTTLLHLIALQEDMSSLAHNILLGYEHGEGWPSGT